MTGISRIVVLVAATVGSLVGAGLAEGSPADVLNVLARCDTDSVCSFSVAVKHPDTGWKHYADRWEIVGPEGDVIATRVLRHPHTHEQPFTRALGGVEVPPAVESVTIRAHCSQDGFGGREFDYVLERVPVVEPKSDPKPEAKPEADPDPEPGNR